MKILENIKDKLTGILSRQSENLEDTHSNLQSRNISKKGQVDLSEKKITQLDQVKIDYEKYQKENNDFELEQNQNIVLENVEPFEEKEIEIADPTEYIDQDADSISTDDIVEEAEENLYDLDKELEKENDIKPLDKYSIVDDEPQDFLKYSVSEDETEEKSNKEELQKENEYYIGTSDKESIREYKYEEDIPESETKHSQKEEISALPSIHELELEHDGSTEDDFDTFGKFDSKNQSQDLLNLIGFNKKYVPYFASFALALFVAVFLTSYTVFNDNDEQVQVVEEEQILGVSEVNYEDENRIAYITNHNVWLTDINGLDKEKITDDGDKYTPYSNINWRRPGILSFSNCDSNNCKIYSYEIDTNNLVENISLVTEDLEKFIWQDDSLFIIYRRSDGRYEVVENDLRQERVIYTYNKTSNSTTFDIKVSDDGQRILLLNSNPNSFDPSLILMDSNYSKLGTIEDDVTSIEFLNDNTILYWMDDSLFITKEDSLHNKVILNNKYGTDLKVYGDAQMLFNNNGKFNIYNLEKDELIEPQDPLYSAKWVDSNTVIAFEDFYDDGDKFAQLSKYQISTRDEIRLVLDSVEEFAIE